MHRHSAKVLQYRGVKIVSGGTDNHLMLVDLTRSEEVTGKELENLLDEAAYYLQQEYNSERSTVHHL